MIRKNTPNHNAKKHSIKQYINKLLLISSGAMLLIVLVLIMMLVYSNHQYESALLCANTAAEFNKEFKSTIDLAMYNHVIRPRTDHSEDELPMGELDQAEEILNRLEKTTSLPDNQWRAGSMLDMCRNLRAYMIEIAHTESYDKRMELLELNIRGETGLTILIENYMHDFMVDEIQELARISAVLKTQSLWLIICAILGMILLAVFILLYSVKIARQITDPIRKLSVKADEFGAGRFDADPVPTDIIELETLDENFDKMAGHINQLMEKQIEDQRSLHRAELELLQAQINPHFLYNTLDSIAILAESEREEEVVTMVTSLSTFFRNSLNNGEDIIPLRAELAQATSYLEIQQIRYSDILTYCIQVPEEIQDCMVPKLILQPLIENALYHGIKNRRGRGRIDIIGAADGEEVLVQIIDNGAGMTREQLDALRAGNYQDFHSGLGIKNVQQRIALYCGTEYGLYFESVSGQGTTVTVRLPKEGVVSAKPNREGGNH